MFVITRMYTIDISVINPLFSGPIEFLWQLATRFSCIVFSLFLSRPSLQDFFLLAGIILAIFTDYFESSCIHKGHDYYFPIFVIWPFKNGIQRKKEKTTSSFFYLPSSHPGHHFTAHHTHFLYFIEFLWEIACIMCLFTTLFYYSWESQYQKKRGFL